LTPDNLYCHFLLSQQQKNFINVAKESFSLQLITSNLLISGRRQVVAVGRCSWLYRVLSLCSHQFRNASQFIRPWKQSLLRISVAVHHHHHQIWTHWRYVWRKCYSHTSSLESFLAFLSLSSQILSYFTVLKFVFIEGKFFITAEVYLSTFSSD